MTDREALERHGYDADRTPIDTLMAAPPSVGLAVAEAMEEYPSTHPCDICGEEVLAGDEIDLCDYCYEEHID